MKPVIKIDIVSDVVCPWCYIGKKRIEKAMHSLEGQFDFDVNYLPFELNPGTPKEGFDQKKYLAEKFGSEERYKQLTGHTAKVAAEEGLRFDFDKQKVSPNTRDAHRLIWFAAKEGKQFAVKEALMKAYFEDGIDLTKEENLIDVVTAAGLDKVKAQQLLHSSEGLNEVISSERMSQQRGVSGVPFYIINDTYGISGAQQADVFIQALTQIGNTPATEGEACDVDSKAC